ncbi:peptidoglycan-binding protein [Microbispora sp. NPDC049125]|uniref:peptidoglycan-binding protein n=1 Tax=Microbispora sp. NPDC049125 TaxID=3154929 RepID=UPI0034666A80
MRTTALIAAVAVVLAGAAGTWQATREDPAENVTAPPVAVTSATVSRGDIVARTQLAGVLGYDGSYTIVSQLPPGVVTATPRPGSVLKRGARLFSVAATRAWLMYGSTPAYRGFAMGMSDGADVRQLERNLAALGMDPHHWMTVDRHFSAATAAAIRRWQAAHGVPYAARTGRLGPGQVVFLPGEIRAGRVLAGAGTPAGPGTRMLKASSTTPVVRVSLTTDRRSQVHVGDAVRVTLPGVARAVKGRVRTVGRVATAPAGTSQGDGLATVPMTIQLIGPGKAVAGLDLAPVQVGVVSSRRRDVLTVPVTALLARPGGGYQVAVLGGSRRLVPVEPGLYDEDTGTVEVSGDGLSEGARVEVPVS